jgi:parallel beta-helix repeat protein
MWLLSLSSPVLAATTVVRPANLTPWGTAQENAGVTGAADFTLGPAIPPLGQGSARLRTPGATDGIILATQQFAGLRLDTITALSYQSYRVAPLTGVLAPALQINIDYDLTDAITTWQGRLIFEPYLTPGNNPTANSWQSWDALAGRWWASGAPGNTVCPMSTPCTWDQVLTAFPNAGVQTGILSGVLFKAGGGWTGFEGHIDAFVLNTASTNATFDFEGEVPCTTICYVDGTNGDDSFGGDTPTSAVRTIQTALNRVSAGGEVRVAAGNYPEALTITTAGISLTGAGAGTDPTSHTIIAGPVASNSGIRLPNPNTTGVSIRDLRVQNFTNGGICSIGTNNNNLTIQRVQAVGNIAGGSCLGGIYVNGPITTVTISDSLAENNTSRGIVIWNGFKQNITITNNIVRGNNCCGIELQDGTASGVTITGNTVENNGDNGIGLTGLTRGAGPNLIANNTLTNNGRFGIEVKLPDGTGQTSGDGSIVVEDNTVAQTAVFTSLRPSELRDIAGIAVFRRGWVTGANNVDLPAGVVVRNNTVSGYIQNNPSSVSTGFGIVVEGINHTVSENVLTDNDVGVQRQAGHLPYVAFSNTDGDQSNLNDTYFGRGNAPVSCGITLAANSFTNNDIDTRDVGGDRVHARTVTNTTIDRSYCTIQAAIDAPTTLDGHTLEVSAGTFVEAVTVNKQLTINGPNAGINPITTTRTAEAIIQPASIDLAEGNLVTIAADNVTLDGLTLDGNNPLLASGLLLNGSDVDAARGIANGTTGNFPLVQGVQIRNNRVQNLAVAGMQIEVTSGDPSSGNVISANQIDNLPRRSPAAHAIFVRNNAYAEISANQITRAYIGIGLYDFSAAGQSHTVAQNTLATYSSGIWAQQHDQNDSTLSIAENSITTADYGSWSVSDDAAVPLDTNSNIGIWIGAMRAAVTLDVRDNTVSGAATGLQVWDVPTSATLTVTNDRYTTVGQGVVLRNCAPTLGVGDPSQLILAGVAITNATLADISVIDDQSSPGCASAGELDLALTDGTTLTDGSRGLWLRGANITATLNDTAFNGHSGDYITLEGNANDLDARVASFNGQLGRELDALALAAVQAQLTDQNDDPALGLVILADATLQVTPISLSYTSVVGQPNATTQPITLLNVPAASGAIASWEIDTITYDSTADDWLVCSPSSSDGALSAGETATLTCGVASETLPIGSYGATVTLRATDTNGDPVVVLAPVAVTLDVLAAPQLQVSPPSLQFSAVRGTTLPAAQLISIANSALNSPDLAWTISGVPIWLTCTPTSGTLAAGASINVSCQPNSTATAGDLSATLQISSATPGVQNGTQLVTVTYTVTVPPQLSVSPDSLTFTALVGAALPPAQTVIVGNSAMTTAALDWTLSGVPTWLTCTPTSGTLAAGESANINCQPNSTATAGDLSATLQISSATPGVQDGTQFVSVRFVVSAVLVPIFSSSPAPDTVIDLGETVVGTSSSRNVTLRNSGTADLNVSAPSAVAAPFQVSPTSAQTLAPAAEVNVTLTCTPTVAGTFTTSLSFTSNDPGLPQVNYTLRCTGIVESAPPAATTLFLPLIASAVPAVHDLTITEIRIVPAASQYNAGDPVVLELVVRNQGTVASPSVWVDLYLNPATAPQVNQRWNDLCSSDPCAGIVWQLPALAAGEQIVLRSDSIAADYSRWYGWLPVGTTTITALVDSWNPPNPDGALAEEDEGNNRVSLNIAPVGGTNPPLVRDDRPIPLR